MFKTTITEDDFKTLKKFVTLNKQVNKLEKERKKILKGIFEAASKRENTASVQIHGAGVTVIVERQEKGNMKWKALAESEIKENRLDKIMSDFAGSYYQYSLKE